MKYPYIIFYRLEKHSNIDNFFIENNEMLTCSLFFTSDKEDLNKLFDSNYQILITYGDNEDEYISSVNSIIADRMHNRWIHFKEIPEINEFNRAVNYCFIHNCTSERELVRPIFSVFTPTYNSYHKIERAYNSLKAQTLKDWEFVIIDDSPDDDHFNFLRKLMINDSRVRLYRKSENNGNIGNVKNEAVGLCRGKYVLEFDHDDEILPFVLNDSAKYFDTNPEVGFIYMDCISLYENGNNHFYGDFICKGYGSYYCQKYNDKWVYVYNTPNINNITLSHLVCCPNHPRIWRKTALIEAGSYCEFLPICDDYEIILRTAITTKIAKIHKFGYIQYMNDNNNNFSLIRNGEINRIGPNFISPIFYERFKINEHMKALDAHEDEQYSYNHSKIWEREDSYEHKYCNKVVNMDYNKQYCIVGLDSLSMNIEKITSLYDNPKNDFFLIENKCYIGQLHYILDRYGFSRFKCYTLIDETPEVLIKYFMIKYKSCENYEIINNHIYKPKYNTDFSQRHEVINSVSSQDDNYLEIGVETGYTFKNVKMQNKVGVDPSPQFESEKLVLKTSDDYFDNLDPNTTDKFDIIFIDGLHQCEQVAKDINNSIRFLNENGKILIDDIIPLNYDEQLKIPVRHEYQDGVLKTLIPWTGDVWKILYHILSLYSEYIDFQYFYHPYYRGVAVLQIKGFFQILDTELDVINNYDYINDFPLYIDLIENFKEKQSNVKYTRIPITIISDTDENEN
jgi:glycosyltransferase involved in cell wall biosynthesis